MGRPSSYNETQAQEFIEAIRTTGMVNAACRKARLLPGTVYRWLERGHRGEEPFHSFFLDVQEARSDVETLLRNLAMTDAKNAPWMLERLFPNDYGMRDKVEQAAAEQLQALLDAIIGELSDGAREELLAAVSRHTGNAASEPAEVAGAAPEEEGAGEQGRALRALPASSEPPEENG